MPSGLNADMSALASSALAGPPGRDWWKAAACTEANPALFFADGDPSCDDTSAAEATAAAKEICSTCSVRRDCLAEALAIPSLQGVWGGTDDRERRRLRRRFSAGVVLFDERPPVTGNDQHTPQGTPAADSSAAVAQPGSANHDWSPPAWLAGQRPSATRWEHLGEGPGASGTGTVDGVEWVCRPTGDGCVAAYARLAIPVGAAP